MNLIRVIGATGASLFLAASVPAWASGTATAPTFRIANLNEIYDGKAGVARSFFTGLNDAGLLVGTIQEAAQPNYYKATIYRPDGSIQVIGRLGDAFPFATTAQMINNVGQVIGDGTVVSGVGNQHPWLMYSPQSTGLVDLGVLYGYGGDYGSARGINNHGVVVGASTSKTGTRAFVWTLQGGMKSLDTTPIDAPPNTAGSTAIAVNDAGYIVGTSQRNGHAATVWNPDGSVTYLDSFPDAVGGGLGVAVDINASGQVAGYYQTASGAKMFLWSQTGGFTFLGHLAGSTGQGNTSVRAVNDAGWVIGVDTAGPGSEGGFLWGPSFGMQSLQTLLDPSDPLTSGLKLYGPVDVNNAGQILAHGALGGRDVSVLLTPVPEPSAWRLLAIGLLLMALTHPLRSLQASNRTAQSRC